MHDEAQKINPLSDIAPLILGAVILYENRSHGAVGQTTTGTLLVMYGLISFIVPRLLPSVPEWSAERTRAHRTAVVAPLNGAISLVAALLLFAVVPTNERNIGTTLLAAVLLVAGVLSVLSGLGARRRAARLDSSEVPHSIDEIAE